VTLTADGKRRLLAPYWQRSDKGYFGGRIAFHPNEAKPRASTVRVGGGHWHTLREILA